MRFRLTVFLIVANAALFMFIWSLDRSRARPHPSQNPIVAFTNLEISGKKIDKPRVLKFENNKWRIVSPIDWKANLFAVNHIKTQLEFLDRQTCFSKSAALKAGHTLAEYGLDEPDYIIKYGGEKLNTIKIGKSTSMGDRFYLLDENGDSILVVEREFVEALVKDMEAMRDQSVFTMSQFEVSSFSVRLRVSTSDAAGKNDFKRIGLVNEGGAWKFETPIVAAADKAEVEALLRDICSIVAVKFTLAENEKTGVELSALPEAITLQGTNKREVLLLGGRSADGKRVYARLEDNPTSFAIDASILSRLENMQTSLRDKTIMAIQPALAKKIVFAENGKTLSLIKVEKDVWDAQAVDERGSAKTVPANMSLVSKLLLGLSNVQARSFVSDAAGADLSKYGITEKSLRISVVDEKGITTSMAVGGFFRRGGVNMRYASVGGSVYGIGMSLPSIAHTDLLFYRNRLVCSLRKDEMLNSLEIVNLGEKRTEFKAEFDGGKDGAPGLGAREKSALAELVKFARDTVAANYSAKGANAEGVFAKDGKLLPWEFELRARYSDSAKERVWRFTRRLGATIQYCSVDGVLFLPESKLINALFELTQEKRAPARLDVPAPSAPAKTK